MGTVYRVCFVEDVASFMFRGALKIFEQLHCPQGRAAAFGNLGMLNALTEHFDEAQGYFEQARELYDGINAVRGRAEIDNQLGLLEILRRNFPVRKNIFKLPLKDMNRQILCPDWL